MEKYLSALFSLWLCDFCSQEGGELVQSQEAAEQAHAASEGLRTVWRHSQWRCCRLHQEGAPPASMQPHRRFSDQCGQWALSFLTRGYVEIIRIITHWLKLLLLFQWIEGRFLKIFFSYFNLCRSAIASILFETRLGCLEKEIPPGTQDFINSVAKMFSNHVFVLMLPKWSRGILPYWGRYIEGWDGIFSFGEWQLRR